MPGHRGNCREGGWVVTVIFSFGCMETTVKMIEFIASRQLFKESDILLVGVSGGVDSVVLIDLLHKAGMAFAVAHCNFKLRGEASELDEALVQSLAVKYDKPYFVKSFDTRLVASELGISIEMAARDLRYAWFEEMRRAHHFDWIVVAHHLDDQAETFFLNLARGTGIGGLTGMNVVNGRVVRPLLFASRKEIETYALTRQLLYREDGSNANTDFQRNKIRHLILPLMEELNPSFRQGLQETIRHLKDTSFIYQHAIEQAKDRTIQYLSVDEFQVVLEELKLLDPISSYLFEFLKPCHFNGDVVEEIVNALDGQPGKQFFSPTHRALLDRDFLLVQKLTSTETKRYYLDDNLSRLDFPIKLSFTTLRSSDLHSFKGLQNIALVDKRMLQFPLILRKWQAGDYFRPLGMKGKKKLSDFFIDEKLNLADKENVWLLTNGEEIVWIIGIRLDDRYKISSSATEVLKISTT